MGNFHYLSRLLIDIRRLPQSICKGGFSRAAWGKFRVFSRAFLDFAQNWGAQPTTEKIYEMNVRPTLREAALLQRMRFWRLRALHGPLGNCSKSRGVKNYLALVRKHAALAEKAGLRETDIYR